MSALLIEDADARELDGVMAVMERAFDPCFGEAWTRGQCAGTLLLPGAWLHVARLGGAVVGFAIARIVLDEAELMMLAVDPSARGRGVGARLLDRFAATAARRGAARLHLEVREGNPALRLYARARFASVGRREAYYRGRDGRSSAALTLARAVEAPR